MKAIPFKFWWRLKCCYKTGQPFAALVRKIKKLSEKCPTSRNDQFKNVKKIDFIFRNKIDVLKWNVTTTHLDLWGRVRNSPFLFFMLVASFSILYCSITHLHVLSLAQRVLVNRSLKAPYRNLLVYVKLKFIKQIKNPRIVFQPFKSVYS